MTRPFSPYVLSGALGLFLAAAPGADAWALACTHNGATFTLALSGDNCLAPTATYNPGAGTGVNIPLLKFTDTGYGFVAAGGAALVPSDFTFPRIFTGPSNGQPPGDITASGPVVINTTSNNVAALYALGGGRITTGQIAINSSGQNAIGVWAASQGAISLFGGSTLNLNGAGNIGLLAASQGAISLFGGSALTSNGANNIGLSAASQGAVSLFGGSALTLNGPNNIGLSAMSRGAISLYGGATLTLNGASNTGVSVGAGSSVVVAGSLTINGLGANAVGVALTGAGPNFAATGGGSIATTGPALQIANASNFIATFENFNLTSSAAALISADPSNGTVTFNSSAVNAGANNLLSATRGSAIALVANASTLTGAVAIDSTSQANVTLNNGSTWNVTGNSTLTSLTNNASSIAFAAPGAGGFKTLTTGSYSGAGGATLTLNTMLGGTGSATDRLVINGGAATGTTLVTIRNAGGTGAQTTGFGIPVIVAANGATTSPGAFQMTNALIAGAYQYTLVREPDQDFYLQSIPVTLPQQAVSSLTGLANAHASQMITGRVLGSILLGANEQINCTDCASAFASVGSFALGAHGRWTLSDSLTVLGGFSYDEYSNYGARTSGPIAAVSLRYDPAHLGWIRPFLEIGGIGAPFQSTSYNRSYQLVGLNYVGTGSSNDSDGSAFIRVGGVARATPRDEIAIYGDLARDWQHYGGYSEGASSVNPFPAAIAGGNDAFSLVKATAQFTHLFGSQIEFNVNAGVVHGFAGSAVTGIVAPLSSLTGAPAASGNWLEFGARIGYRATDRMVLDAFLIGTAGAAPAGGTVHGGLGLRFMF